MPRYTPTTVDDPVAQELLGEYFASRELGFTRGGGDSGDYKVVLPDPAAFTPPRGLFLVLFDDDDAPLGCGGVRLIAPDGAGRIRGEIKHLWMRDAARGHGYGRTLLTELEGRAVGLGARVVVLDTNESLEAAQALYRSSGYLDIAPYNDNPNATHWFGKVAARDL